MTEYAVPAIGLFLVLVVLVILIVTLSGQYDERKSRLRAHRDKRRAGGASANKRGEGQSTCASGPNVGEDSSVYLEHQSDLVIPPPDEKRIEAVAPRNEGIRHVSIRIR